MATQCGVRTNSGVTGSVKGILLNHSQLGVHIHRYESGLRVVDCNHSSKLELGLRLGEIATNGLGGATHCSNSILGAVAPTAVIEFIDRPHLGALASQSAGIVLREGETEYVISGPVRLALAGEPVHGRLGLSGDDNVPAICVVESEELISEETALAFLGERNLEPEKAVFFCAGRQSMTGQQVLLLRSVEFFLRAAMHLGIDVTKFTYAQGYAPLPINAIEPACALGVLVDIIRCVGDLRLTWSGDPEELDVVRDAIADAQDIRKMKSFDESLRRANGDVSRLSPTMFFPAASTITFASDGHRRETFGERRKELLFDVIMRAYPIPKRAQSN